MCVVGKGSDRLLRYVFGISVAGAVWFGLGLLVPPDPVFAAYVAQYLRAAAVAAWVSYGGPMVFARANSAGWHG